MKIVILIDYINENFNKDFDLSNRLIDMGHNVFLVSNSIQLAFWDNKYDIVLKGVSFNNWSFRTEKPIFDATSESDLEYIYANAND